MSFARESALTAGEQVILVQLLARLATYGLKTSDGATLHVPASVATAADTAASDVSRYSGGVALQATPSGHRVTVSVPRQDAPVGLRSYRVFCVLG